MFWLKKLRQRASGDCFFQSKPAWLWRARASKTELTKHKQKHRVLRRRLLTKENWCENHQKDGSDQIPVPILMGSSSISSESQVSQHNHLSMISENQVIFQTSKINVRGLHHDGRLWFSFWNWLAIVWKCKWTFPYCELIIFLRFEKIFRENIFMEKKIPFEKTMIVTFVIAWHFRVLKVNWPKANHLKNTHL